MVCIPIARSATRHKPWRTSRLKRPGGLCCGPPGNASPASHQGNKRNIVATGSLRSWRCARFTAQAPVPGVSKSDLDLVNEQAYPQGQVPSLRKNRVDADGWCGIIVEQGNQQAMAQIVADFPHRPPGQTLAGQRPSMQHRAVVALESPRNLDIRHFSTRRLT